MSEKQWDKIFMHVDSDKPPEAIERLVEHVLEGDAYAAIELLCERYSSLVSYQHQKARFDAIRAGRQVAA